MLKKVLLTVFLAFVLSAALIAPAQAGSGSSNKGASVYVIHGINGVDLGAAMNLPVDINVSGVGCALKNFTFRQVAGPLSLPAGTYQISVSLANAANPCGGAVAIGPISVTLSNGMNYTLIAHLTASGAPALGQFVNNVAKIKDDKGRLSLTHAAYAPAVDAYLARGSKKPAVVPGVTNGASAALDIRPGMYSLKLNLAGTTTNVFSQNLKVREETATYGFVVGSAKNGLYLVAFNIKIDN